MEHGKLTSALWFHTSDGSIKELTEYYSTIFGEDFHTEKPIPLGETPSGYAEMCTVYLFGNPYLIMTTAKEHHKFNDSFALMLRCSDQAEIDKYWDYFTGSGAASMCGWCNDKFGLRWQIIPHNIAELMSLPNSWQVMSKQTKIIIEEYLR
ncbi:MAG: VOC family protein [Ignavibacteria bacterium]|nr:VOC family protein [Ignavibacteria bacterium]